MEQRLQSGLRFLDGDAGLEAAEDFGPTEAVVIQTAEVGAGQIVLHGHGDANLRRAARLDAVESRGAYADDGQVAAVDHDLFAHDSRVRAEAGAPIAIAEDGERMAALNQVVGRGEDAAHGSADAQNGEVVAGDEVRADQFRVALERRADGGRVSAEHAAEDLVLVADLLIHRVGEAVGSVVAAVMFAASGEHHKLLRMLDRKGLQDELVNQCEDRRIGADAEGQRKYRNGQKNGGFAQSAHRIKEISQ